MKLELSRQIFEKRSLNCASNVISYLSVNKRLFLQRPTDGEGGGIGLLRVMGNT